MIKTGSKVKITKGKHKGKSGVVANATGDFVDVKVPGEDILVPVNKDEVVVEGLVSFKDFLGEGDVVTLKVPAKEEIKKILAWKITDDSQKDAELMQAIHDFVASKESSMEDKKKALKKLDDVMGVDNPPITSKDVEDYLDAGERNE